MRQTRHLRSSCPASNQIARYSKNLSSHRRHYSTSPTRSKTQVALPDRSSPNEPPLSSHLRTLMRTMPHSVVVATSTAPATEDGKRPSFKGMTLSSFTTLTLSPAPIVTFNIHRPSQTLSAIAQSKQFFIHILSATESGARVADAFTKGNGISSDVFQNSAFQVLRRQGAEAAQRLDPPMLAADGIIKVLQCELMEEKGLVEVGDHVLVLGKVFGIIEPAGRKTRNTTEQRGLCYLDRGYRQVGPVIELLKKDPDVAG